MTQDREGPGVAARPELCDLSSATLILLRARRWLQAAPRARVLCVREWMRGEPTIILSEILKARVTSLSKRIVMVADRRWLLRRLEVAALVEQVEQHEGRDHEHQRDDGYDQQYQLSRG